MKTFYNNKNLMNRWWESSFSWICRNSLIVAATIVENSLIVAATISGPRIYPAPGYSCRNYKRSKNGRFPITVAGNYIRPPDIVAATMSELLRYMVQSCSSFKNRIVHFYVTHFKTGYVIIYLIVSETRYSKL